MSVAYRVVSVSLLCGLVLFAATGRLAHAHILETDGTIGAVLHIDPEDDPYAGADTTIYLDFKDIAARFYFPACRCAAKIFQGGTEIFIAALSQPGFTYRFPKQGMYVLKIIGAPKISGDFQKFVLSYDIRVARDAPRGGPSRGHAHNSIILYGLSGIITFFILWHEKSKI